MSTPEDKNKPSVEKPEGPKTPEQKAARVAGAVQAGREEQAAAALAEVESEPRESLPKIGTPMKVRELREPRFTQIPGVDAIDPDQEITFNHLVFVRATDRGPRILPNGLMILETPYSGTKDRQDADEVDPRTTLHGALNHHVRTSAGGWQREEALPYIVIAPARGLVERNGNPRNTNEVDTFWDQDVEIPEGTVVLREPGIVIKIPNPLKGEVHVIDRDPQKTPEQDVADTIERLGYTPIKGGKQYSRTKGVSEVMHRFTGQYKLNSGIHQFDATNRFEERLSKLNDADRILDGLRVLLEQGAPNRQAQALLERKLRAIANADDVYIQKFADRNRISIETARDLFNRAQTMILKKK